MECREWECNSQPIVNILKGRIHLPFFYYLYTLISIQKRLDTKNLSFFYTLRCRSGEIGIRSGFKILRAIARAGSIPAFGTIFIGRLFLY